MNQYKVKSLAVSGSGSKTFTAGQVVNESQFPPGRAEDLANRGHLRRMFINRPKVVIGVVIPDRGDRPVFMDQCLKMLQAQTLKPDYVSIKDEPGGVDIDVTRRYREGCIELFDKGCDVVLFMESDDWYCNQYVEIMVNGWLQNKKPVVFGLAQTIYYHIFESKYVILGHKNRASAMSTLVTSEVLNIKWPADNYPYLDVEIWKQLRGLAIMPGQVICIGIKHGLGMVAGGAHNGDNAHYNKEDKGGAWLRGIVGDEDFKFYEYLRLGNLKIKV